MAEYIEKAKLIEKFQNEVCTYNVLTHPIGYCVLDKLDDVLNNMPVADVVEVKHGHWEKCIPRKINQPEAVCSNCGRDVVYTVVNGKWKFENYCPNCGAKMDGERKTDNA